VPGLDIGIIGLPKSGKTTVFNALTRSQAEVAAYASASAEPNVSVVKVPDTRLVTLAAIFDPKKLTPADVRFVDVVATAADFVKGRGLSAQYIDHMTKVDALLHVVRAFEDESVPHVEDGVDPERDIATMDLELIFSDLALIERRLERIEDSLKGAKPAERDSAGRERALLDRIKAGLEDEVPLREQPLTEDEKRTIASFQFLTQKPLLNLLNIGEEALGEQESLLGQFQEDKDRPGRGLAAICGKLEMELVQLDQSDAAEFRISMGLSEEGLESVIRLSYELLGLITFFTYVSDEVRAWTVESGAAAPQAAGKIHTDMEQGFIRAEVVGFDDFVKSGSIAEAKSLGLLRREGKAYQVQDGDVITFLFNV
jgi:hypothetical protein